MKGLRLVLALLVLVVLSTVAVGCANFTQTGVGRLLYELQPHRLWRLNQTPGPTTDAAAYYSVPPGRVVWKDTGRPDLQPTPRQPRPLEP